MLTSPNAVASNFKPAWWCRGAHSQTIASVLFKSKQRFVLKRKRFEIPDGDFLDLDYLHKSPTDENKNFPCVVIVHGLEGSSKAPYVQSLLKEIQNRGWSAIAINMRMCSGVPNRLKQTYHSGRTEDLDWILQELTKEYAPENLFLVGYSIGGNIVLKWLGEQGSCASLRVGKAVAVSVPYNLSRSVEMLDRGFNREVYTRILLSSLKKKVLNKKKEFPNAICYEKVQGCKTFKAFDREVTAPLNGFQDEVDYWSKSSCKNFLKSISLPTLLIHAEDDPFFPGHLIPLEDIRRSSFLKTLFVPHGGHVGFVSGPWPWKQKRWLEGQILNFIK